MPKAWEDSNDEGLKALSAGVQGLAASMREDKKRELTKFQEQNSRLTAIAQLGQVLGLYSGEPVWNNDQLSKETGGMLTVKQNSTGTKQREVAAKISEGEAKRAAAWNLQNLKAGQAMTLEEVKAAHKMSEIYAAAASGDRQLALKLLMEHVNQFGTTGGPEDVAASARSLSDAVDNVGDISGASTDSGDGEAWSSPTQSTTPKPSKKPKPPLNTPVGEKTGKFLGMGGSQVTHKDVIAALGSEAAAVAAEQDFADIQALIQAKPDTADQWEEKFFKRYPSLKGTVAFNTSKKK